MALQIIEVNVSQTLAPTLSTLQRTGALISQGATTEEAGSTTLITQLSDLTAILAGAKTISTLTWSDEVATLTTTEAHGWNDGDVIPITVAGCAPVGYNGTFAGTVTGTDTLTYPLTSSPGSLTTAGTVTLEDVAELVAMGTTFFAQGAGLAVYALELGEGTVADGVAALAAWLTDNPNTVYSFLVPREWDGAEEFLALLTDYDGPAAMTYFFVTTTTDTYTSYTATMKNVFWLVEAPGVATANVEFSLAAPFWVTLNYNPSVATLVPPLAYAYLYGVTPYPLAGNQAILTEINDANGNFVGTGAQGGVSTAILFSGHLASGPPFNFWYSIDYANINLTLNLSNAVINGSNSTVNPMYYNQFGVNQLQNVACSTFGQAVTVGLALGAVIPTTLDQDTFQNNYNSGLYSNQLPVNAVPFVTYVTDNPDDYSEGLYGGLSAVYTPLRGFEQVVFNLNATEFAS